MQQSRSSSAPTGADLRQAAWPNLIALTSRSSSCEWSCAARRRIAQAQTTVDEDAALAPSCTLSHNLDCWPSNDFVNGLGLGNGFCRSFALHRPGRCLLSNGLRRSFAPFCGGGLDIVDRLLLGAALYRLIRYRSRRQALIYDTLGGDPIIHLAAAYKAAFFGKNISFYRNHVPPRIGIYKKRSSGSRRRHPMDLLIGSSVGSRAFATRFTFTDTCMGTSSR